MKASTKIITFMVGKAEWIHAETGLPIKMYVNTKDKKIIRGWGEDICEKIWKSIVSKFKEKVTLFSILTCPFCIQCNTTCTYCAYGVSHGECLSNKSDFSKILEAVEKEEGKCEIDMALFLEILLKKLNKKRKQRTK